MPLLISDALTHVSVHGARGIRITWGDQELTDTTGFLGRPLVVLLTGDVLLPHQLEGGQTLKVESLPVTKTCALPFAISWDSGVSATALVNFCRGKSGHNVQHVYWTRKDLLLLIIIEIHLNAPIKWTQAASLTIALSNPYDMKWKQCFSVLLIQHHGPSWYKITPHRRYKDAGTHTKPKTHEVFLIFFLFQKNVGLLVLNFV